MFPDTLAVSAIQTACRMQNTMKTLLNCLTSLIIGTTIVPSKLLIQTQVKLLNRIRRKSKLYSRWTKTETRLPIELTIELYLEDI